MKTTYKYLLTAILATGCILSKPANASTNVSINGMRLSNGTGSNKIEVAETPSANIILIQSPNPLFDDEDFGDAPEGGAFGYPTSLANNGARHTIIPGIYLGSGIDQEPDGQPGLNADCDDTDCLFPSFGDDEDGVTLPASVSPGSLVNITVSASVSGYLDAWMDFNKTNGWADAGEHIFIAIPLTSGNNALSFTVPANASSGKTYTRFRFRDFSGAISYDGLVANGEVEDYTINITTAQPTFDFGDAPEIPFGGYPTTLANNGARHTIVPGIYLGNLIDAESDGQPGLNANCDDNDCLYAGLGDDEDGVTMPAWVTQGSVVNVNVSASVNGFLDVWFDFNRNNSWGDAGEHVFTSLFLTSGVNLLQFSVPSEADIGLTYVRFRFRDFNSSISYNGLVANGEVEDYAINIEAVLPEFDFGDAPENPAGEYPTTLVNNGARHIFVPDIYLGSSVDSEPDGQPATGANCDDTDCLFPSLGDDEDGVSLPAIVSPGSSQFMTVTASVDGYLDVWMDFNRNNSWADASDHFMINAPISSGPNTILFFIPFDAQTGLTYLRFRFRDYSSTISYDGMVDNGEVEDYSILIGDESIENIDFGDAPENLPGSFPTLLANNGARHNIVPGIYLGNFVDTEPDGQPGIGANCDDNDCDYTSLGDDEDGVILPAWVIKGSTVNLTITASVNGYLDAWMDFNGNDSWAESGEHIFTNTLLTAGSNVLSFNVPPSAVAGLSYARFRFRDYNTSISYDGIVQNGEVEDYAMYILDNEPEFDFGDAPENPSGEFPTSFASNGARHILVPGIFLGSLIDAEPDGQAGIDANCDDNDCLFPSLGDDEDGILIPDSVSPGSTVNISVTASVAGFLDAWMDFNLNNSWGDAGEHIYVSQAVLSGINSLEFIIPPTALIGQSYARFRFRDYDIPINFDGEVLNGEVEDYSVYIIQSQIKIDVKVILGGAVLSDWIPGGAKIMDTTLNLNQYLPLIQPYNVPLAIWNYQGDEQVLNLPRTDIVDWIILELRETSGGSETATNSTTIDKQVAFLLSDGSVVSIDGQTLPMINHMVTQNLYILIWHRNHLGIMSANQLTSDGLGTYSYNFIGSSGAAYGTDSQLEIATGYFGMIPGDALPDGQIDQLDKDNFWILQVGNSGYLESDLNLDGQVNNLDKNGSWVPNKGKGIQIP